MDSNIYSCDNLGFHLVITGGTADQLRKISIAQHLREKGFGVSWEFKQFGVLRKWELDLLGIPQNKAPAPNTRPILKVVCFSQYNKYSGFADNIVDTIINLRVPPSLKAHIDNIKGKVVLMVRRTDFLAPNQSWRKQYDVSDYEKQLADYDKEEVLITSDDEAWCKNYLNHIGNVLPTKDIQPIMLVNMLSHAKRVIGNEDSGFYRLIAFANERRAAKHH